MPIRTSHSYIHTAFRPRWRALLLGALALLGSYPCIAGETDQFLTWDVELKDSSAAFNTFLDAEIKTFIERTNEKNRSVPDAVTLTEAFYQYLFQGLHASRVRRWLKNDEAVDRYPGNELSDLEYQRISIFRRPAFPFILPMAQTIRVGEVYTGIDKIGHMFGFGRRYLQIYHRHREAGLSREEAQEKVIQWGIQHEASFVGQLVDGIFSRGDMEANYQGFRMALAFCDGEAPLFYEEDGQWKYRGGLDIQNYINPDFDESYNANHYAGWRYRRVAPVVAQYHDAYQSAQVRRRFDAYRAGWAPSLSKRMVDAHFDALEIPSHDIAWVERGM